MNDKTNAQLPEQPTDQELAELLAKARRQIWRHHANYHAIDADVGEFRQGDRPSWICILGLQCSIIAL